MPGVPHRGQPLLSNYAQVREPVCTWAERAAEKLHKENQYCRQIGGHLRTSPHQRFTRGEMTEPARLRSRLRAG
ncbi:hypothetical protein ACRPHS_11890 [Pantoea allii]|uniref:DinB/UmuC family translesion DNA polymerase n=1 Tax=Pantoea allii TaxID=574096 RepID=UPI00345E435E